MARPKDRVIIATDVSGKDDKLVIEIFRDDTKRTRTVTLFQQDISLDLLEERIQTFKEEIPWDFMDSGNFK
ncbi:MAG: hypothetical protein H6Q14_46 [Bacteroidetes bacterium]|nr:hypothetical protein [Bacteroidota bacterium]